MEPMKPMAPMEPMKPIEPMKPMAPMTPQDAWWPKDLGEPSSSGAQNDMEYAFFADKRRLLIKSGATVTTYNSANHLISGVSQQSDRTNGPAFTSQNGLVDIAELEKLS